MDKLKLLRSLIREEIRRHRLAEAGGQEAGTMEVDSTPLEKARAHMEKLGLDIPNFDANYKKAQSMTKLGKTKRREMPVIDSTQVKELQRRLKDGFIDVERPFAPNTKGTDPFPQGLSGKDAKRFLSNGLKDNEKTDDVINVSMKKIAVGDLIPIQKQIYFDNSIGQIAKFGIESSKRFLASSLFVASSDNRIIDGHHRYLSALLVNPKMKVNALVIDMPIKKLLPMTLAYGDALGNKRNA